VQVPVIVSDRGGRYITDLKVSDFALYEDGVKQEISFFGSVDEPFSAALLIDSSGSTQAQLMLIKQAAIAFIESLRPQDRVLVMEFNDSVDILCEITNDMGIMRRAIESIKPGEFTQVYEAVYTGVWERLNDVQGRKALIIFTDGIDTASTEISQDDTLDAVVESEDVIVYPIRFSTRLDVERKMLDRMRLSGKENTEISNTKSMDSLQELDRLYRKADEYLYELAEVSGGKVERADRISDLQAAFKRIANELRHQYLLGYYPVNQKKDDGLRKIDIKVSRTEVRVRARPGYRSSN
jgi:VWFA-related protein